MPTSPGAVEAVPAPKPKRFPLVVRDSCGQFTMTFATDRDRARAAKSIQTQTLAPKEVESLEGVFYFRAVPTVFIPNPGVAPTLK